MGLLNLFSKRQKRLRGEFPDVYVYDEVPRTLRVQIVQIINDGIGAEDRYGGAEAQLYDMIHRSLCREYGVFQLHQHSNSHWESIANYILQTENVEHIIDILEVSLRVIDNEVRSDLGWKYNRCRSDPDATIREVNERFKEHGIGYEFVSGEMIRIDSQLIHSEVVKPALSLLSGSQFNGANEEFLKAHEHYRHGRHKECLAECLKAFESTLKSICTIKGWSFAPTDTAKALLDICMNNGLFPTFMQSHLGNLRSILESGVPTVRNKLGGHGQGATVTTVSEATARFALHTTATNILFFMESSEGK